ncbi:MAG: TonB-dependent receptor [Sphingomonadales bacterium]|nr:TonB-dependent receptor [Sphingomonadales bacterium]
MRKSYLYLASSLTALLFMFSAYAQTVTLKGTVRNSDTKEAVPAVSVAVKGTSQGTYTNADGAFSISVSKLPAVLVFTSVGYLDAEVSVSDASQALVVDFKVNNALGQEVVVAATRTPTRLLESPVTVERLSSTALRNVAAPNFYEALGNLKGVDVHTASLTFRTVTTRGFVSSGNTRLNQLMDGMDNQAPGLNFAVGSMVGPSDLDVESVEVLSGASSALYGSGGMNGTVLINTKNPFKYQGLSYNIKQGMMHVDQKQRAAAPFYDWSFRWAKAYKNKLAIKLAASMVKGSDWEAEDYRNKTQIGILSAVAPGNRTSNSDFNGINMYGDETAANMNAFANFVQGSIRGGILGATGGSLDVVSLLNAYYGAIGNPRFPTEAQRQGFYAFPFFPAQVLGAINSPQLKPLIDQMFPFYNGLKNNYFGNATVSRTGYEEQQLVDYNTLNIRFNGGIHYKFNDNLELSFNSFIGAGTTVYTGADRYSLNNLSMGQHKVELRHKNWFVRGYTTQENAGKSYNASALGAFLNERAAPSANWFPLYIGTFSEGMRLNSGLASSFQLHQAARTSADATRLIPGTKAYTDAVNQIKSTPISKGGALFLDKTDLWSVETQFNISDMAGFSDKVEMMVGTNWKQYVLNSQGTLFADTAQLIRINEYGGYMQLKKKFFDDGLTLSASGRYDRQTNFKGRFTPRLSAVIKVAKENFLRLSYQTSYRFPTNQNQYISLVTGSGVLMGCLPQFQDYYKLNSTRPGYTAASVLAYRSGSLGDSSRLVRAKYQEVKPETVKSYELGYKGVIGKKLLIDGYIYYSRYQDFLVGVALVQSRSGANSDLYSPFSSTNLSYVQNSADAVTTTGWGVGFEYQWVKRYVLYGNVFSDRLSEVDPNVVTYFNAPRYRTNIGLRNDNVYKNFGFNVVYKWQDRNYYEGTFITGTLPAFGWWDAQVTYRPAKNPKSTFRVGGTNIANNYQRTGFGSPAVGGLYYVSYGYNLF